MRPKTLTITRGASSRVACMGLLGEIGCAMHGLSAKRHDHSGKNLVDDPHGAIQSVRPDYAKKHCRNHKPRVRTEPVEKTNNCGPHKKTYGSSPEEQRDIRRLRDSNCRSQTKNV